MAVDMKQKQCVSYRVDVIGPHPKKTPELEKTLKKNNKTHQKHFTFVLKNVL